MSRPPEPADPAISVVVSTYNRAERLPLCLGALTAQRGAIPYEIIVVDNNSTDDTAAVVARAAAAAGGAIRYAFEPRQGLSHGRNTGIALARAPIIAFCDDDVRVAEDWTVETKRALDENPQIDYVGGRVLPNWLEPPPAWLTTSHWSPLALQDYGTASFVSGPEHAVCLVGASLAFRRRVFDAVGLFTPALGRVKDGIGSTEDHDMQLRLWRVGMQGMYVPAVVVIADVTPDRLSRAYHWRWHAGHGRHCALMRLREMVPADLGPFRPSTDLVTLFGSPAFVYTEFMRNMLRWGQALLLRKDALFYVHQMRHLSSYIECGAKNHWPGERNPLGVLRELSTFALAYGRKKLRRRAPDRSTPSENRA